MKKIYPDSSNGIATVTPVNCRPITEQQYEELVERTNCAECAAETAQSMVQCLEDALEDGLNTSALTTNTVSAENGSINCLNSTTVNADTVCSTNVCTTCVNSDLVTTDNLNTSNVNTTCISATNADLTCVSSDNATIDTATINNLSTTTFSPSNVETTCVTADSGNIGSITSSTGTIGELTSTKVYADEGEIDKVTSDEVEVTDLKSTNSDLEFITHTSNYQTLIGSNTDQYIELPLFTNGTYYLEGITDGNIRLWSIEVSNSKKNLMYRWSQSSVGQILKVYDASFDDGTMKVFIVVNTQGNLLKLYHQSQSTDNTEPPTIWDEGTTIPEPFREHEITDGRGTYMDNLVVTDTLRVENLEMDWLSIDSASIYCNLGLTSCLDEYGKPVISTGREHDYVAVSCAADGATLRPHWDTPANCTTNGAISNTTCHATEHLLSEYNGTVTVDNVTTYPVSHLNACTCVGCGCADATLTSCNLTSCNSITCNQCVESTLEMTNTVCLTNTEDVTSDVLINNTTCADECVSCTTLAITNGTTTYPIAKLRRTNECISAANCCDACMNTMPLTADFANGTVKPGTDLLVQNELKAGTLNVAGDTHVAGDLYVEGKTVTQESETISTGADAIVLRQNKAIGLSNTEVAGVIVHNYDGNDNNTIVGIDNTGTVRVGDATGTDTTYTEIWLDVNGNWYDTDGVTPITVTGELTKYDSKVVDGEFTKYTNAVFTVFTLTDLEPVATRAEASAMDDHAITCWDATNKEIHTIVAPTGADQKLVTCVNATTGDIGYCWSPNNSEQTLVYRFNSRADYEAFTGTISTGSIVYIDNEDNWIYSEDV